MSDSTSVVSSSSSSSLTTLTFNSMIHMISIKLTSSNYLLWRSQIQPLLQCQDLFSHVDGTMGLSSSNTLVTNAQRRSDQSVMSLLLSSVTEEVLSEVIGLSTTREVWSALVTPLVFNTMSNSVNHQHHPTGASISSIIQP
ncbi:hypothetical protein Droror1_Dr00011813 [Drosera rotundifolia]